MERRDFGATGIVVSALGFGAGQIGGEELSEDQAGRLLHEVLDLGITFIDTARGYGLSEERIGRHLKGRRGQFVLSSKGGYGVDGVADWTAEVVTRGVEDALRRMACDVIDVFHLHSCPRDVLERGEVLGALERARDAGKIKVAAYSGENDALAWAIDSGRFGSVQCSVNLCDQRSLDERIVRASARGLGLVAKRPIANVAWRFKDRPVGDYAEVYWTRLRAMQAGLLGHEEPPFGIPWGELALRFSAFSPGVSSAIVGTRSSEHLQESVKVVARGPLPGAIVLKLREAFRAADDNWDGQV